MTLDQITSRLRDSTYLTEGQLATVTPLVVALLEEEMRPLREQLDAETKRATDNAACYDDVNRRQTGAVTGLLAGIDLIRSLQSRLEQAEAERDKQAGEYAAEIELRLQAEAETQALRDELLLRRQQWGDRELDRVRAESAQAKVETQALREALKKAGFAFRPPLEKTNDAP